MAWHPDGESCLKMHECAAQRPSLPSLTMPIPPHWHPDSFGTLRSGHRWCCQPSPDSRFCSTLDCHFGVVGSCCNSRRGHLDRPSGMFDRKMATTATQLTAPPLSRLRPMTTDSDCPRQGRKGPRFHARKAANRYAFLVPTHSSFTLYPSASVVITKCSPPVGRTFPAARSLPALARGSSKVKSAGRHSWRVHV